MANNVQRDKFGNEFMLVGCKDKNDSGFGKGFVEIKGQLFKIEPSNANKEGYTHWVKITKMDKKKAPQKW